MAPYLEGQAHPVYFDMDAYRTNHPVRLRAYQCLLL